MPRELKLALWWNMADFLSRPLLKFQYHCVANEFNYWTHNKDYAYSLEIGI